MSPLSSGSVQVEYDASQLNAWYEQVLAVISELPVELYSQFNFSDLDEGGNRILLGFSSEEARAAADEKIAERMAAPEGVVVTFVQELGPDD